MNGVVIIEGHVQGLSNLRSLGEAGIPAYVIDKNNCLARYSRYCRKFFICPDYNSDNFYSFLMKLGTEENLTGWLLLPSNDHAAYTISKFKDNLKKIYSVITPDIELMDVIYDKSKLLTLATNINIPVPKTLYYNTLDEFDKKEIPLPVITKGRNGLTFYKTFKTKVLLSNTKKELFLNLEKISKQYNIKDTFTQEIIPLTHKTLSFTAFAVKGEIKTYWMGLKLREHPEKFGTATFAQSVYEEDCLVLSKKLLSALEFTGICEIEYLQDPRDKKFKLIEINARTWLWVGLAKACGINFVRLLYNYINNQPVEYPDKYLLGVKWINWIPDLVFSFRSIIHGNLTIKDYIKSFKGSIKPSIFSKNDMVPTVMFWILLPLIIYKRT